MHVLYPDILFWIFFLGINMLIFLPPYLVHRPVSSFFPRFHLDNENSWKILIAFFSRENHDVFRISADLAIISLAGYLLSNSFLQYPLAIFSGIYIILIILFQITNAVFVKIYHKAFSNIELLQYLLIGYKIVKHSAFYQIVLFVLGVLLLLGFVCYGIFRYFDWLSVHRLSLFSLAILGCLSVLPFWVRRRIVTMVFTNKVFPLHFPELYKLIFKTRYADFKKSMNIDFEKVLAKQPDIYYPIHTKPNVFIIVIESYGRIVLDEIEYAGNNYKNRLQVSDELIKNSGYHFVSALARSPVSGAGSWIAYSSFLFGINMENQMLFDRFFSSKEMYEYRHLTRFLQQLGYRNYRVNAVGKGFDGIAVPWDDYSTFYAVDEWIHFKDMQYEGQMYGFGPAPPDQFILHKSLEAIQQKNVQPFSYFLLTQNSHSPFFSCPDYNMDWRACNIPPDSLDEKGANFVSIPKLDHYFKAIDYELESVMNFIAQQHGDNIFIVFGDHQPPMFNEAKKGVETPVHIISKNPDFIKEWESHGFQLGLMPDLAGQLFNFEGMLSLFVRAFVKAFSHDTNLPAYHPNGISFKNG